MGRYFKKFKSDDNSVIAWRGDLEYIKKEISKYGDFKGGLALLDKLWREFSESHYCASFLIPDNESIREFVDWLDEKDDEVD